MHMGWIVAKNQEGQSRVLKNYIRQSCKTVKNPVNRVIQSQLHWEESVLMHMVILYGFQ